MAGPKKPPPKGGSGGETTPKPFLGDDLNADLDAWDATFDALHGGPEARTEHDPMAWPTPAPEHLPDLTKVTRPPPHHDLTDADRRTLDRAISEVDAEAEFAGGVTSNDADPRETDFSGLGAEGAPAALGDLLGRGGTAPPIIDEDHDTRVHRTGPIAQPEDDDGVFTSASRPNVPRSFVDDLSLEDDELAPPPPPAPPRSPAIVRRVRSGTPDETRSTPPGGHEAFGLEATRVADYGEIERSTQSTTPPPLGTDDAYDDIEIESTGVNEDASPTVAEDEGSQRLSAGVRRTAHVLRREHITKPPITTTPDLRHVIEMDVDELPNAAPETIGEEDDFSDVAAAVGADDAILDEQLIDSRRAPPPPPRSRRDLEAALADLGDASDREPAATAETARGMRSQPEPEMDPESEFDEAATRMTDRPPALVDLYPRIKTPTSVPPLGALRALDDANRPNAAPTPPIPVKSIAAVEKPRQTIRDMAVAPRNRRLATPLPIHGADAVPEVEPVLDLDSIKLPEQMSPLASNALDEASAASLLVYEREIATVDDSAASAALRIEAGRLCERLADLERARAHYDAALLADPRATAALRGLRRLARASSDLDEATRHIEAEIAVAGALERRPLGHYRVDLLMASGEQDLARVAVGEILDSAPSDVRALLAQLELAFLDGRAEEFGIALEQLAHAVSDAELRAAVQSARAVLAAHHNDAASAATWFAAAAESDPASLAARLGAIRQAAANSDGEAAGAALVDLARQVADTDPISAASLAVRAQQWATSVKNSPSAAASATAASTIATTASPSDPLVARVAAETAAQIGEPAAAAAAYAHWAACAPSTSERAYAAARAAELEPSRGSDLWSVALKLEPGDDYAAAQLRTAHVAAGATQAAIDVDLAVAVDAERERARLRAAYGLIGQGQLDGAIDILIRGRVARPSSIAFTEALGEALAAAGKWNDRAKLFAEVAAEPGDQLDRDVAQLRSALAWEEAVSSVADPSNENGGDLQRVTAAALAAWETVIEHNPSPTAHAAAIVLATRLGDRDVLAEVLTRAQTAERSAWAASSLALRRARLVGTDDPQRAEAILKEVRTVPSIDDPRRTAALVMGAARRKELEDAAQALEDRAAQLDDRGSETEIAALRLRAAQLALDGGDAVRATALLHQVEQALPHLGVIPDLLAAARRRAGDRPTATMTRRSDAPPPAGASTNDAFARIVRDGDLAASQDDAQGAIALYQRALELRPADPLATVPLVRIATQIRDAAPIAALALARLRTAESSGDAIAKADAYELLAHIDGDLRADPTSAQIALESASQADPSRVDLLHRLEREYAAQDQVGELLRLRRAVLETMAAADETRKDRAALLVDIAGLATRDHRPDAEISEIYRTALGADPKHRLALHHLESMVRREGFSQELADLEERIADYFEGDPKSQAAFWTRAGETLAELGQIDAAVLRFGRAEAAVPGHAPALEGWRQAALKGQLWIDVAEAATRQAKGTDDAKARAGLHHLAGVALMDKALVGEQAMTAFRRALDADPGHRDAFLRMRILLEEDANHDDLATLLANRLAVETDAGAKIELHRALAELHRNFLSDRDTAKMHYRAILDADGSDLRAHAAVADIAWEQGNWQEAAEALMARARLEHAPEILKTLCYRLGLIYADRLVDVPMALKAFQRALTYQPDDENTLIRLADLATTAGEWKLALGACERLVKNETDPDRRSSHLHRVARIFKNGFGDMKRAERALNLALDGAPTNDEALAELIRFYREANDITSVRVHLNRVTGAMRVRLATDPRDGVAARVISRAMSARSATGVDGSLPIARAAAELADLLGTSGDPERLILNEPARIELALLNRPDADEVLYPRGVQNELRQLFRLLGDRIAKHVGVDLRPYGVSRGDRQRARDSTTASVAQSVATGLGFGDIDVYISQRQPWAMVAEPTSPISLVLGSSIGESGGDTIRFAAGGALKLAQAALAIPARLSVDDLGVLVIALLRLFQPEFPTGGADPALVAAQAQKLKRLVPTGMLNELRPFALAVDGSQFQHAELARDLRITALRAGLVASGSLIAGLRILSAQTGTDIVAHLEDPLARGLVAFALSEDHAVVAR
ncbi:MAG TPA: hypothetical protein VGO00_01395 [Kofleriaceae bacterium]|nr:hypothetical protein [Kofleriaceae bacterium]